MERNAYFPITTTRDHIPVAGCTDPNITDTPVRHGYAIDGSGYYAVVNNYTEMTVYDQKRNQIYEQRQSELARLQIDSNGNYNDDYW